jgi:hypothetical protein
MQNLNPTRIIARRGRDIMLIGSLLLLAGIVVCLLGAFVLVLFSSPIFGTVVIVVGGAILLVALGFILRGLTYRRDNEAARIVGDFLARELNQRFVYIRNLSRPGLGYIDAVLIGPPGALVFRITEDNGNFLNEDSDWLERKDGKDFEISRKNYTRECVTDIYALRSYLTKRNLADVPVYGVIVFVGQQVQLATRHAVVPIAELRTLMVVLRRDYLAQPERVPDAKVTAAVDAVFKH